MQEVLVVGVAMAALLSAKAGVYRVGGDVSMPSLTLKVEPEYTEEARAAHIEGVVRLLAVVGSDGHATNMQVEKTLDPGLDVKAVEVVYEWTFQPAMKGGKPAASSASVEVVFRLP